jgi:hypothetical protein
MDSGVVLLPISLTLTNVLVVSPRQASRNKCPWHSQGHRAQHLDSHFGGHDIVLAACMAQA